MADEAFANNPWSAEFWSLTRQGAYVKKYGVEVAKTKARQAGAKLGDLKPSPAAPIFTRNFILIKKIGDGTPGGKGYTGVGVPGEIV
jgi:hypothetical protein